MTDDQDYGWVQVYPPPSKLIQHGPRDMDVNARSMLGPQLDRIEELLEEIRERQIAESELRQLGHRVVWNKDGKCNVPGMPRLKGDELAKQLARQAKWYGKF